MKMKRRNMAGFFTAIFIVCASAICYSYKTVQTKKFGLQLYSVRDSIRNNIATALGKVSGMGYKYIETAGYSGGKIYGMEPVEFKELCMKKDIVFLSAHTGKPCPGDADHDKTMAWWDECIEAHFAAGAKYIVQPSMGGDAFQSLERLKKYCDYFNAVGEKCRARGLKFGYHNHDKEFLTSLEGQTIYDFMLRNTDPSKVIFEIDLYWCVEGGKNPVDYFNRYPGRFELWHIKDREELGSSGKMDFKSIWAASKQSGMKYGIVEVEKYNFDQYTSCRKSLEFLISAKYVKMP